AEILSDATAQARAVVEQQHFKRTAADAGFSMSALHLLSPAQLDDPSNQARAADVEDLLGSQIRARGLIASSAPAGSVLHVSIAVDAHESKSFTGRERTVAVTLVLEQPAPIVGVSGRYLVARQYTGHVPSTAPDGFVSFEDGADDEDESNHRDVALVLKS